MAQFNFMSARINSFGVGNAKIRYAYIIIHTIGKSSILILNMPYKKVPNRRTTCLFSYETVSMGSDL